MSKIKYFFQFVGVILLFSIFKLLGRKYASILSGNIMKIIGPLFRSKEICHYNLSTAFPKLESNEREVILKEMWFNYGRILAEYIYISDFRNSKLSKNIIIENQNEIEKIKNLSEPVIFVSGHFNNFELMAMQIENSGIECAALYRPLNNPFLNKQMEKIRKKDICKTQIKKGRAGTREIIKNLKQGKSIALMIDQRVREGEKIKFFNNLATTTTIPAQLIKKYNCEVVPIYIERNNNNYFKMYVSEPIKIKKTKSIEEITLYLNVILEKMILKNIDQWIWSHDRWKE